MSKIQFEYVNPGIQLVGTFGPYKDKVGIWLLSHGKECIIIEMPEIAKDDPFIPWNALKEYFNQHQMHLKFMTATHVHGDHFYTYPQFHEAFPDVPIIINPWFYKDTIIDYINPDTLEKGLKGKPSVIKKRIPLYCFDGDSFETHLSGESLYLLRAPKHSWGDTMIVFRGTMMTGDWVINWHVPNSLQGVPIDRMNESIDFLENFCRSKNYSIHTTIASHNNGYHRNIDFFKVMEATRPKK